MGSLRQLRSALLSGIALVAAAPTAGLQSAAPLGGGRFVGPATRLRRSLRASTAEGFGAELVNACAGPTILAGWALHLGAAPMEVGLLGALPQLAQLPSAWVTALLGRRRVAIVAVGISRQALLPLAVLPLLGLSEGASKSCSSPWRRHPRCWVSSATMPGRPGWANSCRRDCEAAISGGARLDPRLLRLSFVRVEPRKVA